MLTGQICSKRGKTRFLFTSGRKQSDLGKNWRRIYRHLLRPISGLVQWYMVERVLHLRHDPRTTIYAKDKADTERNSYRNGAMTASFKDFCGKPLETIAEWKKKSC